ncbi:MAG: DUF4179 domain-containing protein [Ruminiclostridium sp.]|nr:DUF4179 domain-containing protein [Ruminiclostridium sp.]
MRPLIALFLSVLMALCLTACGQQESSAQDASQNISQESVPAPETATLEEVQEAPFETHFDMSGLSEETIDRALQTVDQKDTHNGITVQIQQSLWDGQNLYVAFDLIYPAGRPSTPDLPDLLLASGKVTDPAKAVLIPTTIDVTYTEMGSNTHSYFVTFSGCEISLVNKEISLILPLPSDTFLFTWTVESDCESQTVDLVDRSGAAVGTAVLSPFTLSIHFENVDPSGFSADGSAIVLLDAAGEPIPETWSISGDPYDAVLEFFIPMEPGTIRTVQVGPYTGHF